MTCRRSRRHSGSSHQQARPTQSHSVERSSVDPLPGEDPGLAVQGQEIGVLGHQHVREQGLGRHPAGDRPLRGGRLHHRPLAGPAAVAGAADHPHPQHGGDDVEHLARVLADDVHGPAAAGAALVLDVEQHLDPRQVRRQGAQVASPSPGRPRGAAPCRRLLLRRLGRGHGLLEVLQAELELVGVELLRAPAEPPALQLPDQEPQLLDLGLRPPSRSARTVSRSACKRCESRHSAGRRLPPSAAAICSSRSGSRGRSSSASDMALFYWPKAEKARVSAHQAVLGRGIARGCSRCHGKPSSRVASCAPVSRTTPSAGEGQQNRPASSLFAYRTRPVPS